MSGLSEEQARFVACLVRWLEIRQRHYRFAPKTADDLIRALSADIWHSALFKRLLAGKEPLPEPPPLACSYPWYEIVENGRASDIWPVEGIEQGHYGGRCAHAGLGDHVHICQSPWLVLDRRPPDEMVVTYKEDGPTYLLRRTGDTWELERFE